MKLTHLFYLVFFSFLFSGCVVVKSQVDFNNDAEYHTKIKSAFVEVKDIKLSYFLDGLNDSLIANLKTKNVTIQYFKTNRGGDITFHGPQQIVGYPIIDLEKFYTDIGKYLRSLEEVIILTMQEYGLKGERSKGETGVWLDAGIPGSERKICAMGVRSSRWITMHGFAFNVNTDLKYFNMIIPCGIENKKVTSLQNELNYVLDYEETKRKIKVNFEKVFGVQLKNM